MRLSVTTRRVGSVAVVTVEGELDALTDDLLIDALAAAATPDTPHLVLDLTGVTFMDSMGVRILIGAFLVPPPSGGRRAIGGIGERVERILRLLGLLHRLPVHPTAGDALAALGRATAGEAP